MKVRVFFVRFFVVVAVYCLTLFFVVVLVWVVLGIFFGFGGL